MVRGTSVALGLLALSMPLGAQVTDGPYWPADCSAAMRLKNNTGLSLGGVWLAIKDDDLNNPVEIESILLTNAGGTKIWDVDDNEDGDNDDGETDTMDATARDNPEGWHRVQARSNADVIAPGTAYRITLCGENGKSLQFRPIEFFFSKPGVVGGDNGVSIGSPPLTISAASGDEVQVTLVEEALPPLTEFTFSFVLKNGFPTPLDKLEVFERESEVDVIDVTSSGGGTYKPMSRTYTFSSPIPPGGSTEITFELDGLGAPARRAALGTTEIVFQLFVPPPPGVPSLGTWGKLTLVALLGGVGFAVLRPR